MDASDNRMAAFEQRLKHFYELRATEEPETDPEAALRFSKAISAADVRPGERILDVGAKRGALASSINDANLAVDYTGFDVSEANVAIATKAGLNFVQGDVAQQLPFDDVSFDAVFCLELLEHVMMPVTLLSEIRRVLKDDGRAVVSVPSPYSWVEVAREVLRRSDPEGHINCFTTPVMQNVAALTGFRIERRMGTSIRIPKTLKLISTDSILARSRIYLLRPAEVVVFAGRSTRWA